MVNNVPNSHNKKPKTLEIKDQWNHEEKKWKMQRK